MLLGFGCQQDTQSIRTGLDTDTRVETDAGPDGGGIDGPDGGVPVDAGDSGESEGTCVPGNRWPAVQPKSVVGTNTNPVMLLAHQVAPDGAAYVGACVDGALMAEDNDGVETPDRLDCFVAGIEETGQPAWVQPIDPCATDAACQDIWIYPFIIDSALDSSGRLLVLGDYYGKATFGSDSEPAALTAGKDRHGYFLARYTRSGGLDWALQAASADACQLSTVLPTEDGSVLIMGNTWGTCAVGNGDLSISPVPEDRRQHFLAKLDSDGNPAWAMLLWGTQGTPFVRPSRDGTVLVFGNFDENLVLGTGDDAVTLAGSGNGGAFLARYRVDGSLDRARAIGDPGLQIRAAREHDDGAVTVLAHAQFPGTYRMGTGEREVTVGTDGNTNLIIARFDAEGALQFAKAAASGTKLFLQPPGVDHSLNPPDPVFAICDDGTAYAGLSAQGEDIMVGEGDAQVTVTDAQALLTKLDANGNPAWVTPLEFLPGDIRTACEGPVVVAGRLFDYRIWRWTYVVASFDDPGDPLWQWQPGESGLLLGTLFGDGTAGVALSSREGIDVARIPLDGDHGESQSVFQTHVTDTLETPSLDHLFTPPNPVCEPADVRGYIWLEEPAGPPIERDVDQLHRRLKSGVSHWFDESCIAECADRGDAMVCLEAACTTQDGLTVSYRFTFSNRVAKPGMPACTEGADLVLSEDLRMDIPEGLTAWTRVEWHRAYEYHVIPECDGGFSARDRFTATWRGAVDSALPADRSVDYSREWYAWDYASGDSWEWHSDNIDIAFAEDDRLGIPASLTINDDTVEVGLDPIFGGDGGLWLNGDCVGGEFDYITWEISEPCGVDTTE